MTQIGSTLFTVSWNVLFGFLRATAAGRNRCFALCEPVCRVDSEGSPSVVRGQGVQLDGQAPPSGQAGLTRGASAKGGDWKSWTGKG